MRISKCKWCFIVKIDNVDMFNFRALEALRKKEISANKASKVYKIPSSTLYKIARKEGIELAQPFNAVATTWSQVRQSEIRSFPHD